MPARKIFQKEQIINTAFKILKEKGWEGISARSIAKELNASTMPVEFLSRVVYDIPSNIFKQPFLSTLHC
jgi:hypothetical protein